MTKQSESAPSVVAVDLDGYGVIGAVKKAFSTGSVGYYGNGKVVIAEQAYQVGITITLVGSKPGKD